MTIATWAMPGHTWAGMCCGATCAGGGYAVHYVQNFTDIDDKILNRASAEGATMAAIAERYIQHYFKDMHRLNVMDADEYPRVTEHIGAIHALIGQLEAKGYAPMLPGAMFIIESSSLPTMASFRGDRCQSCRPERVVAIWLPRSRPTQRTLLFGSALSPTNLPGTLLGERADRGGTSNVP